MAREPREIGPRLEALLDERDHLRIKLSLVEDNSEQGEPLALLRRRLVEVEREGVKKFERQASRVQVVDETYLLVAR